MVATITPVIMPETPEKQKTKVIRARVTEDIKARVDALVTASGESEAYILRQAIREYLERQGSK